MSTVRNRALTIAMARATPLSHQEMAKIITTSVAYAGGYLYSGESWKFMSGYNPGRDFDHLTHWVKEYDCHEPSQVRNLEILMAVPEGEVLEMYSSLSGGTSSAQYELHGSHWVCVSTRWSPSDRDDEDEVWDAYAEAKAEAKANALAKAKAKSHSELFSLGSRARLVERRSA